MAFLKFSPEELRNAKKAGFKRKKPRKPKSKTLAALTSFQERYNQYVKDMKQAASDGKKLEALKKEVRNV
jgi:hypothetical protein